MSEEQPVEVEAVIPDQPAEEKPDEQPEAVEVAAEGEAAAEAEKKSEEGEGEGEKAAEPSASGEEGEAEDKNSKGDKSSNPRVRTLMCSIFHTISLCIFSPLQKCVIS